MARRVWWGPETKTSVWVPAGFWRGVQGYKGSLPRVRPHNLTSALQYPEEVDKKLSKESSLNRRAGPFKQEPFSHFRTSPLGLVEKKIPGKFRLIHHLSYPPGDSNNDGISPVDAHVQYQSIDHRSCRTAAATLGPGLFFVKNRHCRCLSRCPSAPIAILPVCLCLARAVLLRSLPAHGLQCQLQDFWDTQWRYVFIE